MWRISAYSFMSPQDELAIHTSGGIRLILRFNVVHVFDVLVNRKSKIQSLDAKETLSIASVASQQPKHCRYPIKPKQKHTKRNILHIKPSSDQIIPPVTGSNSTLRFTSLTYYLSNSSTYVCHLGVASSKCTKELHSQAVPTYTSP